MKPSIEKLQRLWRARSQILRDDSPVKQRANRLYELLEQWKKEEARICGIAGFGAPEDAGIPTNGWSQVKEKLRNFYNTHPALQGLDTQIEEISEFLHLQYREGAFRLSSQAKIPSPYEVFNTEPTTFSAPETYFGSYNFPFEIIQYLLGCPGALPIEDFRGYPPSRFTLKFLWMLVERASVLPVFSLRSFRALAPLFQKHSPGVDWGAHEDAWELSLDEFRREWPAVSQSLCQEITGEPYHQLSATRQRELATVLFLASVTDTTTKNGVEMLRTGNQAMILYGPPGTGKTYHAQQVAMELLGQGCTLGTEEHETRPPAPLNRDAFDAANFTKLFGPAPNSFQVLAQGCWEIVQFHPSYSYQDFIGGIMPDLQGTTLGYVRSEGIFKRFCDGARAHPNCAFVFIIDEINRADLSAVFGELLFALEYRGRTVSIPHFGPFSIPSNVFVIGTMNTSDKSLVTFDLALRRRFLFLNLQPDLNVLYEWNEEAAANKRIQADELAALIASGVALNRALVETANGLGLPRDYGIGQAYFMKIRDFCVPGDDGLLHVTEFARERLWDYHLEPLLEEYLGAEAENLRPMLSDLRQRMVKGEVPVVGHDNQ